MSGSLSSLIIIYKIFINLICMDNRYSAHLFFIFRPKPLDCEIGKDGYDPTGIIMSNSVTVVVET